MASATQYDGLLDHLGQHLGEFRFAEPPDVHGPNRGFGMAVYEHPKYDMFSAVSNGLRFQEVTSLLPEEFVCSLHEDQTNFARGLIDMVTTNTIRSGTGLEYDGVVETAQPFIPDSAVQGVLACTHPYLPEEFHLFPSVERPALQLITLVPITQAEAAFVHAQGAEALQARWSGQDIDLLSVYRPSAV